MSLDRILDPLAQRLSDELDDVAVTDVAPVEDGDLPRVVLSLADVQQEVVGIGRVPRGTRSGALPVTASIDLADPVLDLGGGEKLNLLSSNRKTLTLPHGPVVRADGTTDLPFAASDVGANDGAAFTLVAASPTGRQFTVDPVEGTLTFGRKLAPSGTLVVDYHVGQWDVTVTRAQGTLAVDVYGTDADQTRGLARAVAGASALNSHGVRTQPSAWPAVLAETLADDTAVRTHRLLFRLDAEVEDNLLTSSGGVILRIAVTGALPPALPGADPEPIEPFTVQEGVPT